MKEINMDFYTYEEEIELATRKGRIKGYDSAFADIIAYLKSGETIYDFHIIQYDDNFISREWKNLAIALGREDELTAPKEKDDD